MSKKLYLPVVLMMLTILIITGFQLFWLNKNFQEEKRQFNIHTNILFRESMFQLQASKLQLDTGLHIKFRQKQGVVSMVNVLRSKMSDSATQEYPRRTKAMVISVNGVNGRHNISDTNIRIFQKAGPGNPVLSFLSSVDSLQDPISAREATAVFTKILAKEQIDVPFTITVAPAPVTHNRLPPEFDDDIDDNKLTIGFSKPMTYAVSFQDNHWFLLRKLKQPIIISFLLIGVTVLSFWLLYRNLIKQRKLTELKNDFISNITHELKTPIATVSVAIEALRNFSAMDDPERTKEYLNISANELQRLSLLVDKVLKLSMFEKNAIELKKEWFDFKDLLAEVTNTLRPAFDKQKAIVNTTFQGEIFMIEADKIHLSSVIYNLLDNALKYTGGQPVINLQLSKLPYDIIELRVSDNGIGIPAEYRTKIFTKFFRVPSGDIHNFKGYGLGLSYVLEVVRQHMGYIMVESEVGRGSTFIMKMPVKEKDVIQFDEHRKIIKRKFKLG